MTIVMTVSFHLPADKRDAAITAALAMQAATTRERGCSEYRMTRGKPCAPMDSDGTRRAS